jgi:hypothetical protein
MEHEVVFGILLMKVVEPVECLRLVEKAFLVERKAK